MFCEFCGKELNRIEFKNPNYFDCEYSCTSHKEVLIRFVFPDFTDDEDNTNYITWLFYKNYLICKCELPPTLVGGSSL